MDSKNGKASLSPTFPDPAVFGLRDFFAFSLLTNVSGGDIFISEADITDDDREGS